MDADLQRGCKRRKRKRVAPPPQSLPAPPATRRLTLARLLSTPLALAWDSAGPPCAALAEPVQNQGRR